MNADADSAVESGKPAPAASSKNVAPKARRALEWVWQGAAMAELGKRQRGARARELRRRAKLCLELAEVALNPAQRLESGPALAQACELLRQGVYWALLATRAQTEPVKEATGDPSESSLALDPEAVWASADRAALTSLFGDDSVSTSVTDALSGSFADLAELPEARLLALSESLRAFAESLLGREDPDQLELERIWLRRVARLALVALAVVALVIGAVALRDGAERSRDVAAGKPWRASSHYGVGGCPSPLQKCPESQLLLSHQRRERSLARNRPPAGSARLRSSGRQSLGLLRRAHRAVGSSRQRRPRTLDRSRSQHERVQALENFVFPSRRTLGQALCPAPRLASP